MALMTAQTMRTNYLLELFGNFCLSLYCGGIMYQGIVETPSRNQIVEWRPKIVSLAKSLEICTFYFPLLLLPGIIIPIVRYAYDGHVLFLVGAILSFLIFPITGIFLIKEYNKVKAWRDDEKTDYESEEQIKTVLGVTNTIRCWHAVKAVLSYVSLILFIIAMVLELEAAIDKREIEVKVIK